MQFEFKWNSLFSHSKVFIFLFLPPTITASFGASESLVVSLSLEIYIISSRCFPCSFRDHSSAVFKAGKIPAVMQLHDKANPYSPQVHVLLMCAVQTDGKENKVKIQNTLKKDTEL